MGGFYARNNRNLPRAPKGMARRVLCALYRWIVDNQHADRDTVVCLEADHSDEGKLRAYYEHLGFHVVGVAPQEDPPMPDDERGALMASTFGAVLDLCNKRRQVAGDTGKNVTRVRLESRTPSRYRERSIRRHKPTTHYHKSPSQYAPAWRRNRVRFGQRPYDQPQIQTRQYQLHQDQRPGAMR